MARENQRIGDHPEEEGKLGSMPEGCIAHLITFTSPPEACRFSSISTRFKSAAESDAVWERFLPSDYKSLITESERLTTPSSSLLSLPSKKEIFRSLCHNPILIDEGKKSFWLDKWSGKKCYMIAARDLGIIWGDTPAYWSWIHLPENRFPEVARLNEVCWFEIRGKISICFLSPGTLYTAYLVFKQTERFNGFEGIPVEVSVGLVGSESHKGSVYLHDDSEGEQSMGQASSSEDNDGYPKKRGDAWLEVNIGDFYNAGDNEGELEMSALEVKVLNWKGDLLVQGIELRPKRVNE